MALQIYGCKFVSVGVHVDTQEDTRSCVGSVVHRFVFIRLRNVCAVRNGKDIDIANTPCTLTIGPVHGHLCASRRVRKNFNWFHGHPFTQRCKRKRINAKLKLGPGSWGWGRVVG